MELVITNTLQSLIFPPGLFLLLLVLGLILLRFRPLLGRLLLGAGLLAGYLLSTYAVSGFMMKQLQVYPALTVGQVKASHAGAIVVLSADRYRGAPEYGHDTVGSMTLVRLRYGVYLQRLTGLPMVVTGGHVLDGKGESFAAVMASALKDDYGVQDVWLEDRSRTTAENAIYTQQLLQRQGVDTVLLVTQSYHMPRAVAIFQKSGLKVIAAPTELQVESESDAPAFMRWLPNAGALTESVRALHEMLGRLWYRIRY